MFTSAPIAGVAGLDRREFLKGSVAAAAASSLAGPLGFLCTKASAEGLSSGGGVAGPYGSVQPAFDMATGLPLIQLPPGFKYRTFSWNGDTASDGNTIIRGHDGMDVVASRRRECVLIRNHETFSEGVAHPPIDQMPQARNYDRAGGGGTVVLRWKDEMFVEDFVSISGTIANCAGGRTHRGEWITCEEEVRSQGENGLFEQDHGYIFVSEPRRMQPVPIRDAGRFSHEAVSADPRTGVVYLTEDNSTSTLDATRGASGFYRFLPDSPNRLDRGGRLEMLQAVDLRGTVVTDLRDPQRGATFKVRWVPVRHPDLPPVDGVSNPFMQGYGDGETGGARFQRLEGSWYDTQRRQIAFCDTEGGARTMGTDGTGDTDGAGEGAVWRYDLEADELECIFVSADRIYADNIDNLTVSPSGDIWLCEDGDDDALSLLGLTDDGNVFEFARNNIVLTRAQLYYAGKNANAILGQGMDGPADFRGREWAGATFDPTGRWMFVNIQDPGITFAITGPWGLS